MSLEVAIILLSWNRKHAVLEAVDRIKRLAGVRFEIVIIDNASSDGSPEALEAAHSDVFVIRETVNRGFAAGVNRGLAEAATMKAPYAWLLNDDTDFQPDALLHLLRFARAHPQFGLISPRLVDLSDPSSEQFSSGLIDWVECTMHHNVAPATFTRLIGAGATAIVPGTALLCEIRAFQAIGPFDSRFFAYWEDTDYSVRAERAGFQCTVVPSIVVGHAATAARQIRPPHYAYYMVRNEALFWSSHQSRTRYFRWLRRWLIHSIEWVAESRDCGNPANADACLDGIWHALTRRFGPRASHPPAPSWFKRWILAHPYFIALLIAGKFSELSRRRKLA